MDTSFNSTHLSITITLFSKIIETKQAISIIFPTSRKTFPNHKQTAENIKPKKGGVLKDGVGGTKWPPYHVYMFYVFLGLTG